MGVQHMENGCLGENLKRKQDLLLQALLQRERLRRVDDEGLETVERAATANL